MLDRFILREEDENLDSLHTTNPVLAEIYENPEYEQKISSEAFEYHFKSCETALERFMKYNSIRNILYSNGDIIIYDQHFQKKRNEFNIFQSIIFTNFI